MALFIFTKAMLEGKPIDVFNYGNMARDFTYVDDIVEGVVRLIPKSPDQQSEKNKELSEVPYQLLNIGYGSPVDLMDFIHEIEKNLGIEADKNLMEIQPGDVPKTWADIEKLQELTGFQPKTSVKEGVRKFIDWYKMYYNV
jgi:UDP-glucuronate 4-epimerase